MAKLLSSPKLPQEDPKVKALRDQEEARAELDRTRATQDQLSLETRLRNRSFGLRSLFGSLTGGNRVKSLLGAG
jgi:hypothetical protein